MYANDSPASDVEIGVVARKELRALTFDQAGAPLDELKSPVRDMVLLALTTSMNVAEILGLRRKRVNLTGDRLHSRWTQSSVVQPLRQ
jgi:hypothetical protein